MNGARTADAIQELARRTTCGIEVTLLWERLTNAVRVVVLDWTEGGTWFEFEVEPERALDAFHHPYVYAASAARMREERHHA
jgi:hypothetical protein